MLNSRNKSEKPAAPTAEPLKPTLSRSIFQNTSWDIFQVMVLLADKGSFKQATIASGMSINTLRAKFDLLEHRVGRQLVKRSVQGVQFTEEGEDLLEIVRQMNRLVGQASDLCIRPSPYPKLIKMIVSEGLGTFWLIPHLAELLGLNPDIKLDIECTLEAGDIMSRQTDISIQLDEPTAADTVGEKIGTMHVLLYAAPQYLNKFGTPESIDDLKDHRLVWQDARLAASEATRHAVDTEMLARAAAVTTNTSTAHFWSIAKGAGIGFLPTYVSAIARGLVPVDIGLRIERDIYLVTKKSPSNADTVALIGEWVKQVFRPGDHPWFANEFADPKTFVKNANSEVVVDLFKPKLNEWVSNK